jgi:hypothetical protein
MAGLRYQGRCRFDSAQRRLSTADRARATRMECLMRYNIATTHADRRAKRQDFRKPENEHAKILGVTNVSQFISQFLVSLTATGTSPMSGRATDCSGNKVGNYRKSCLGPYTLQNREYTASSTSVDRRLNSCCQRSYSKVNLSAHWYEYALTSRYSTGRKARGSQRCDPYCRYKYPTANGHASYGC